MKLKNRWDDEVSLVKQLNDCSRSCAVCGRNGCGLQHGSTRTLQIWKSEGIRSCTKGFFSSYNLRTALCGPALCGPAFCGPALLSSLLIWLPTWRSQSVLSLVIVPLFTLCSKSLYVQHGLTLLGKTSSYLETFQCHSYNKMGSEHHSA